MKRFKFFVKNQLLSFLLFFSIILVFYWKSLFSFFQGDEWYYFTLTLPFTDFWYGSFLYVYESLVDAASVSSGAHFTPVSNFLYFLSVKLFAFTYWPYALSGILIHALNTFLVFTFVNKLLLRQRIIAGVAALFFAITSVHQQAVTWVMTYLWTELSTTFFLLSLIFLLNALRNKKYTKDILYSSVFALLAFLSKESTIILIPLIILTIFLLVRIYPWKAYLKTYGIAFILYSAYRIFLPNLSNWISSYIGEKSTQGASLDQSLVIFRIITYPLKVLAQVFIPAEWIRGWAEFLTPFAYPHYADDMKILGKNYVVFTQSAGSDIITYFIAAILLSIIILSIYKSKKETRNLLVLGLAIIIFSAWPLILIATYAPWWGYVTYIDSRHLYITSVGASFLFTVAVKNISSWIANRLKISFLLIVAIFLLSWGYSQYFLIQKQLDRDLLKAGQRKTILSKILNTVPADKKIKALLVESNEGYYGFSAIPPFQTNLGQILAVYYYQKKQLPEFFIHNDFLTKGGIRGEGYKEEQGKGFGYFVNKKTVFDKIVQRKFNLDELFSFSWDGEKNRIYNRTREVRDEISQLLEARERTKDWKHFRDSLTGVSFVFPPSLILSEGIINSSVISRIIYLEKPGFLARIEILKVPEGLGFYDVYSSYKDSDENILKKVDVKSFELDSLHKNTVLMANSGSKAKYFIPTHREVVSFLVEEAQEQDQRMIEKIIGSIEYKMNQ